MLPIPSSKTGRLGLSLLIMAAASLCVLVARRSQAQERKAGDYLSAKLRQDVNRLKRDAEKEPTGEKNIIRPRRGTARSSSRTWWRRDRPTTTTCA